MNKLKSNIKKTLTTTSALAIVATSVVPASVVSVLAEEVRGTDVEKEVQNNEMSQKDVLTQKIEEAKRQEQEKLEALNKAKGEENAVEEIRGAVNKKYETAQKATQTAEVLANAELISKIEENIEQIESLQKTLETANKDKSEKEQSLNDKKEAVKKAEADKLKAEAELEEAKKQAEKLGVTPEALQQTQNKVTEAEKVLTEAQESVAKVESELAQAKDTVTGLQTELSGLVVSLEDSKKAAGVAAENVAQAKKEYEEKKAILDATTDEEARTQAEAYVKAAEKNVEKAEAEKETADKAVLAVETEIQRIQTEIDGLQGPLVELEEKVNTALTAKQQAETVKAEAEDALKAETENHTSLLERQKKAQELIHVKEAESKEASSKYWDLFMKEIEAEDEFRAAREKSDQLTQQLLNENKAFAKGSLGFYEAMGATKAAEFLTNIKPAYAKYTNIGALGDATNLIMMRDAIDYMKKCNELRKKEGVSELKVTHELMAIAQIQTNASTYTIGHSHQHNVGENLAWGYNDPFEGWYEDEKRVYDYVTQVLGLSGKHNDVVNLSQEVKQQIVEACNLSSIGMVQTGHYLNVIDTDYATTGFAINTSYNQEYGVTHGQTFMYKLEDNMIYPGDTAHYEDGGVYTVDEYAQLLNGYIDSLLNDPSLTEGLSAQLRQALQERDKWLKESQIREQAANEADRVADVKKAEFEQAKAGKLSIDAEVKASEAIIQEKTEAVNSAVQDLTNKEQVYNELEAQKAELENKLNMDLADLKAQLAEQQTLLTQKKEVQKDAKNRLNAAKQNLMKKQEILNGIIAGSESAKAEYDKALANYEQMLEVQKQADEAVTRMEQQVTKKQAEVQSAEQSMEDVEAKLETVKKNMNGAYADVEVKRNELKKLQEASKDVTKAEATVKSLEELQKSLNDEIAELTTVLETMEAGMKRAELQLKEQVQLKAELEKAKQVWEDLKAGKEGVLESDTPELQHFKILVNEYVRLHTEEEKAKAVLLEVKGHVDKKRVARIEAEKAYQLAKDAREKLEKELDAYLDTLVETEEKKEEDTDKVVITDVDTGVGTNTYVLVGSTVLSGALALAFLEKRKKLEK